MDKNKQREEFEQSMHRTFSGTALDMRRAQAGDYMSWEMNVAWEAYQLAWQAAIASIEIELPNPDDWGDEQAIQEFQEHTIASLTSIGIRVKG